MILLHTKEPTTTTTVKGILQCSFRSDSVKRHSNRELIFGVKLQFSVVRCIIFPPRNSAALPNQITASEVTKLAEKSTCRLKVVPFSAALAADTAAVGFREVGESRARRVQ